MNSTHNLFELPWDTLLMGREIDPDSRQVIRKEIIRRCPAFQTKLDENQWNLIHLASEYGYVEIVKALISVSSRPGNMSPCFCLDEDGKTPLDYAAMNGNKEVIQILVNDVSLLETNNGVYVQDQLMKALHIALKENHFRAFYALAMKYMENWDSKKVAIIKIKNKLLIEPPRPSYDVPTEVYEALNQILLSAIQCQSYNEYMKLEKFLASDPLLFKALSTRSCPLETQFYFCVFTRQTDDLLDEISKIRYEFGPAEGREQSNIYPMHSVVTQGQIHIMKLLLIYESGSSSLCHLKDMFGDTSLHRVVQNGRVSEVNILLSTCWECAGMVSERNETALHCALSYDMGYKSFKTLLEWYIIKEEISSSNGSARDWECGDIALDLLVDGYAKIVKELLFQKDTRVSFQRDSWETKEYFVVIKCKNKVSMGTSFRYQDYIKEVTSKTTNRTILSLSVDSRSIITLKVLIRSVMVRGILGVRDLNGYTVFDLLEKCAKGRKNKLMQFVPYEEVECAMGTLLPKWSKNVYKDAKEKLGEGINNGHEGLVTDYNEEQLSVAAKEDYENVPENVNYAGHKNDSNNANDENDNPHDQEMLTDISTPHDQSFESHELFSFDSLMDELQNEVVENGMGKLHSIWYDTLSEFTSSTNGFGEEGTNNGHESLVADHGDQEEQLSMAAKEDYENVKADHRNDNAEDDNEELHDPEMLEDIEVPYDHEKVAEIQQMLADINIADRLDGYTIRNQYTFSSLIDQGFESLEDCRDAIKDAAILGNTEVRFTRSTSERIVAECSNNSCEWKLRAKAKNNSNLYVVTKIENEHSCPPLNGTTNKLATPKWVSNHIIDNVRQDQNISTQKIRHIMNQSRYQIDISCKTAERAKRWAMDRIQELQSESKKQRKNPIASSSLALNSRFLEQIPKPMHKYSHSTEDVENDGHCGYRVIAMQSGYGEKDAWKQVRQELLFEVVLNENLYVKLLGTDTVEKMRKAFAYSEDHAADPQYWLSLPDAGYVIANAYKAVVVSLSVGSGNFTFLPLLEPPPEGRPHHIIALGFVNRNHFVSVILKPDAPLPRVDRRWDANVSEAAEVWKTPYLDRFDKFEEIMGFNSGPGGNTGSGTGSLPILV